MDAQPGRSPAFCANRLADRAVFVHQLDDAAAGHPFQSVIGHALAALSAGVIDV
jgi:hypothetical protein